MWMRLNSHDDGERNRIAYWQEVVCRTFFPAEVAAPRPDRFHGSVESFLAPDVAVSMIRGGPQQVVRSAPHIRASAGELFMINLQLAGTGTFSQDGRDVVLKPGDFACTDSTRDSAMRYDDDFAQIVLHVPRELIERSFGNTRSLTTLPVSAASPVGRIVSPMLRTLAEQARAVPPESFSRLTRAALPLVMAALAEVRDLPLARQPFGKAALCERAKAWLRDHARDPSTTATLAAAALGVSPRYLQEAFQAAGHRPSGWLWDYRLDLARQDLENPAYVHQSVTEIAFRAGFSDAAHFSRRFRSAFGCRPSDVRAGLQRG